MRSLLRNYKTDESVLILKLGIPIAFAQLANFFLNVEDSIFVGRLGVEHLGAVSIANALFHLFMIGAMGFLLSLDYLISHAYGRNDQKTANSYLAHGLYLATLLGIPFTFVVYFGPVALTWMKQDPAIVHLATIYLQAICFSLVPFLFFTVFRQFLQAMGVATPVLIILTATNIVNILANVLMVFGWDTSLLNIPVHIPRLEIVGSGWATVIARSFMALSTAAYTFYFCHKKGISLFTKASWAFSFQKTWEIVRLGAPAAGQVLLEMGAFATATFLAGKLGAIPLAAHQSALQIASITFMIPLGISSAGAVRVAQSLGAGNRRRAVKVGWTAFLLGSSAMATFAIIMFLIPGLLVSVFSPSAAVIATGSQLMIIAALFQLFDGAQVVGTGILRGIGNTRASFLANLLGHWLIGLPLGAFLGFILGWGIFGIWIGLSIGLVCVAAALIWSWHRLTAPIL